MVIFHSYVSLPEGKSVDHLARHKSPSNVGAKSSNQQLVGGTSRTIAYSEQGIIIATTLW